MVSLIMLITAPLWIPVLIAITGALVSTTPEYRRAKYLKDKYNW